MTAAVTARGLEARLAGLRGIGETAAGVNRLAWTAEAEACRAWFSDQAAGLGRRCAVDPAGNLWAMPDVEGPWWGVGSHLDSVRDGGSYDGPLGVAAAFEVAARSAAPVAVVCLADEEGARYNTPTFGSRALVGRLDSEDVIARRDDDGIALGDAMAAAGVDPTSLGRATEWLGLLRGFLELHIDQTRDLAQAGAPTGVVSSLATRLRLEVELHGRADHAGTTRREQRRDAMSAAARVVVAAEDLAADAPELVVTAARILVEPNALTTVPAHVRLWLDARALDSTVVVGWRAALDATVEQIAARTSVSIELRTASRSEGVSFDPDVRGALQRVAEAARSGNLSPELVCFAGHDAGVLGERIPAGMVLVRNPSGISHAPEEHVDLEDAALAATEVLCAVEELAL